MGLKFWAKKENWDKPFSEKVAKRISKIATPDLTMWLEQAISETNRALSNYQKNTSDVISLQDLTLGAEAIHALAAEINKRSMI
jgi:hypothetical protein